MVYPHRFSVFFSYIAVFLFLYMPFVELNGYVFHLPYIYLFVLTFWFAVFFAKRRIPSDYLYVVVVLLIPYGWVIFVSALSAVLDVNMQVNFLNAYLVIFAAFGLSLLVAKNYRNTSVHFLVRAVYFSGVAHAFIMVIAFFVTSVRDALYSFVILGKNGVGFVDNMTRSPGLTSGGGDGLSVIQASALVFGAYYVFSLRKDLSPLATVLHVLFFLVLFFSILLSGRTGLVVLLLGLFMLSCRKILLSGHSMIMLHGLFLKLGVVLFAFAASIPLFYFWVMDSEYARFGYRVFEGYHNLTEHGELKTRSTEALKAMYFVPESSWQILWGDGNFGRDTALGILASDIGYIRVLFGGGIFGLVFFYMPILFFMFYFLRKFAGTVLQFPLIFVVVMLFLVNLKVYHLYSGAFGFKLFILVVAITISSRWYGPSSLDTR